ncbi:hypothetical protein TNCV_3611171 [Trichonephila clavipes]|nr:hypothetical protein TNCV_3611171 [Trichonephila clavipes]
MPTEGGKIADIALIAGKEFRNWVFKDLGSLSQVVSAIQKIYRKIVLSLSNDSVMTARLKTYNVHLHIGAHWARDQVSGNRQGRQKNKRSREPSPTEEAEEQEITEG